MKHRLVILFPAFVLIATIVYCLYLIAPLYLDTLLPLVKQLIQNSPYAAKLNQTIEPYIPSTSPATLYEKINQYRLTQNLPAFIQDPSVCQATPTLPTQASDDQVFSVCQNCTHATLVSISKYAQPNLLLARLLEEPTTKTTLVDPKLTHLCIVDRNDSLTLLFAQVTITESETAPLPTIVRKQVAPLPTQAPTSFSEDQLWEALSIYRSSQGRSSLERDERLCTYARKRVNDQITMMNTVKQAEYPNPDKYPLDAHQGFAVDADSGYAFEVTGVNHLAENLAYYPGAQAAIHIIEWGWDTSTEGHRETQLSTEFSKACISSGDGFYVAIFGN